MVDASQSGIGRAWAACREKLSSDDSGTRWQGVSDAVDLPRGHAPAVSWLTANLLEGAEPRDRAALATALGLVSTEGCTDASCTLAAFLQDSSAERSVRQAALWSLQQIFQGNTELPCAPVLTALAAAVTAADGADAAVEDFILRLDALALLVVLCLQARSALSEEVMEFGAEEPDAEETLGGLQLDVARAKGLSREACMASACSCMERLELGVHEVRGPPSSDQPLGQSEAKGPRHREAARTRSVQRRLEQTIARFCLSFAPAMSAEGGNASTDLAQGSLTSMHRASVYDQAHDVGTRTGGDAHALGMHEQVETYLLWHRVPARCDATRALRRAVDARGGESIALGELGVEGGLGGDGWEVDDLKIVGWGLRYLRQAAALPSEVPTVAADTSRATLRLPPGEIRRLSTVRAGGCSAHPGQSAVRGIRGGVVGEAWAGVGDEGWRREREWEEGVLRPLCARVRELVRLFESRAGVREETEAAAVGGVSGFSSASGSDIASLSYSSLPSLHLPPPSQSAELDVTVVTGDMRGAGGGGGGGSAGGVDEGAGKRGAQPEASGSSSSISSSSSSSSSSVSPSSASLASPSSASLAGYAHAWKNGFLKEIAEVKEIGAGDKREELRGQLGLFARRSIPQGTVCVCVCACVCERE